MPLELIPPNFEVELLHDSKRITCPYCNEHIETEVEYQIGSQSLTMSCITMPCLCCWVPLVVNRFKDSKHSCPNCKQKLAMIINF